MFMFSSEVAVESSSTSGNIIRSLISLFEPDISLDTLELKVELYQPIIRKLAHLMLYIIGGLLISNSLEQYKGNIKYTKTLSVLLGMLYATTDELHQLLVPGRSGEIVDILIDTIGVCIGMCVIQLIIEIRSKINGKK